MVLDFTLVLQGYSMDTKQMEENVRYYTKIGIENIVISSYSQFITDEIREKCIVIEHDLLDGNVQSKSRDTYGVPEKNKGKGIGVDLVIKCDEDIEIIRGHNINYQLHTTKAGMNLAKEQFNTKYAIKSRADITIHDLDKKIPDWIEKINDGPPKDNVFDLKVLSYDYGRKDWYINDFFMFGSLNDLVRYYDIPYSHKMSSGEIYISSTRIKSFKKNKYKKFHVLRSKYFEFDSETVVFWHKYNKFLSKMRKCG
jgi:hypothetical protein